MKLKRGGVVMLLIFVSGCGDYSVNLGDMYFYYSEGQNQAIIVRDGSKASDPMIPCNVESYAYDGHFIVARQAKVSPCFWETAKNITYPTGDTFYWIIRKDDNKYFGPLGIMEFQELNVKLSISTSLVKEVLSNDSF